MVDDLQLGVPGGGASSPRSSPRSDRGAPSHRLHSEEVYGVLLLLHRQQSLLFLLLKVIK